MAARAQREAQRLSGFRFLVVTSLLISTFFITDCQASISYSRQLLLDIGSTCMNGVLNDLELPREISRVPWTTQPAPPGERSRRRRRDRKQRRGQRGGLRAKLRLSPHRAPVPSLFLANVRSLASKMDELRLWTTTQRWIRECNIMIVTESWLNSNIPDSAVELDGRSMFRADRVAEDSGKSRGGGLCIYVNKLWCTDCTVVERQCSTNLEYLMIKLRPFYLPREHSAVIVAAVYIPPDANAKLAMRELSSAISKQQTAHPDGLFIVAGDFNHSNLRSVLPKFHQNVSCPTRGDKTLDHVYTNTADTYKAVPLPHLGQSDHLSLFLLPKYVPLIKRVKTSTKTVKVWPEGAISSLQHQFDKTDWSMFSSQATTDSHTDLDTYTSDVMSYINSCIDNVTSVKRLKIFPNQKPWMNAEVRLLLKARDAAFRTGDPETYSSTRANLKKGIRKAKHIYKLSVEEHFHNSDPRRMWKGIQTITDYKPSPQTPTASGASFSDELNQFYARFDQRNDHHSTWSRHPHNGSPLTLSSVDVCSVLSRVHARKAAGPDGVPGRVLRACAGQLSQVFTDIFNLSLAQAAVPACWKKSTIIPVPKRSSAACLNDFRPVALTPIVMKCFEKLVLSHLKAVLLPSLDPHQFAYRANRSTEDAISTALHSALTHLDDRNTYIRMLFIDFSSAFNTVIPTRLVSKLSDLGINTPMCNWVLDFLTDRPQSVRWGNHTSATITLNTGVPQGCVLSPMLFSLFTHDCVPLHTSNIIIKFADDTTVVGQIRNNDESAYREEIQHLTDWCNTNNLILNTDKTKEIIVDYRKTKSCTHSPVHINGDEVERVSSFKFLGVHISSDLSWTLNTSHLVKKAQQRLYFLRRLRKHHLSPQILTNFYRCTIESILTNCVTVWYSSSTVAERKALQRVVKTAQRIIGVQLPAIRDIHHQRCMRRAHSIIQDPSHPCHTLFHLLPSGRRYRSIRARTSRFRSSFVPTTITLLNSRPH